MSLGAGICLIVLLGYLHAAFGAFRPSYSYYDPNSFSFMQQQGIFGADVSSPGPAAENSVWMRSRAFLCVAGLVAACLGLWWLWKEKAHRAPAMVAAAIVAYYFLFNASFYWWKAGLSFGPRYAGASIPLLCVGLAMAWSACHAGVAPDFGGIGCVQCVRGADGGFDDLAIVDAGQLSDRAFGVAGVLVGAHGDEPRFDVDGRGSGTEWTLWSVQSWPVRRVARAREFDAVVRDLGNRSVGVVANESCETARQFDVIAYFVAAGLLQSCPGSNFRRQCGSQTSATRRGSPCKIIFQVFYGGSSSSVGRGRVAAAESMQRSTGETSKPCSPMMHADVDWPNGMEGGRVLGKPPCGTTGRASSRCWMRTSSRRTSRREADGRIAIEVHQVVHDKSGKACWGSDGRSMYTRFATV